MRKFHKKYFLLIVITIFGGPAMGELTVQTVDKKEVAADFAVNFTITIDRPAIEVWPHLIKHGSWMGDFTWTHVSGEPNTAGEVLHLHHESIPLKDRVESNALVVKAINIIPMYLSHHVNPLYIAADGSLHFGTNILTLNEKNGKTEVNYYGSKSLRTSSMTEDQVRSQFQAFNEDATKRWGGRYLPRLKELVEK